MADADGSLRLSGDQPSSIDILYNKQTKFARLMEIQFLTFDDFPYLSKTARMLAHTARTLHDNCRTVFRKYQVHGGHILNTLFPMLKEGIDLNEPTITAGALKQSQTVVSELLEETNKVNKGYIELVPRLKYLKQEILQQNVVTDEEAARLRREYEEAVMAYDTHRYAKKSDVSSIVMMEAIFLFINLVMCWLACKSLSIYTTLKRRTPFFGVENIGLTVISAGLLIGAFAIPAQIDVRVILGFGSVGICIFLVRRYLLIQGRNNNGVNPYQPRRLKNDRDRLQEELQNMNGMFLVVDFAESASVSLTEILQQIDLLISFWQRMLNNIRPLASPAGAADIHQKTRKDDLRDTFLRKMALTETGWRKFIDRSSGYISKATNDRELRCEQLYQFLSAPIGTPKSQLEARIAVLQRQLRSQ